MITDEMLRAAAARSCEIYVAHLEKGFDPEKKHEFSPEFLRKIERLKRRAKHPVFYKTTRRVASIALAILITGGAWITVDAEARAAFVGWVKEVYEEFFVYRMMRPIFRTNPMSMISHGCPLGMRKCTKQIQVLR